MSDEDKIILGSNLPSNDSDDATDIVKLSSEEVVKATERFSDELKKDISEKSCSEQNIKGSENFEVSRSKTSFSMEPNTEVLTDDSVVPTILLRDTAARYIKSPPSRAAGDKYKENFAIIDSNEDVTEVLSFLMHKVDTCTAETKFELLPSESAETSFGEASKGIKKEDGDLRGKHISVEPGAEGYLKKSETHVSNENVTVFIESSTNAVTAANCKKQVSETHTSEESMEVVDISAHKSIKVDTCTTETILEVFSKKSARTDVPVKSSEECKEVTQNSAASLKGNKFQAGSTTERNLSESDKHISAASGECMEVTEIPTGNVKGDSHSTYLTTDRRLNVSDTNIGIIPEEVTEVIGMLVEDNVVVNSCIKQQKLEELSNDRIKDVSTKSSLKEPTKMTEAEKQCLEKANVGIEKKSYLNVWVRDVSPKFSLEECMEMAERTRGFSSSDPPTEKDLNEMDENICSTSSKEVREVIEMLLGKVVRGNRSSEPKLEELPNESVREVSAHSSFKKDINVIENEENCLGKEPETEVASDFSESSDTGEIIEYPTKGVTGDKFSAGSAAEKHETESNKDISTISAEETLKVIEIPSKKTIVVNSPSSSKSSKLFEQAMKFIEDEEDSIRGKNESLELDIKDYLTECVSDAFEKPSAEECVEVLENPIQSVRSLRFSMRPTTERHFKDKGNFTIPSEEAKSVIESPVEKYVVPVKVRSCTKLQKPSNELMTDTKSFPEECKEATEISDSDNDISIISSDDEIEVIEVPEKKGIAVASSPTEAKTLRISNKSVKHAVEFINIEKESLEKDDSVKLLRKNPKKPCSKECMAVAESPMDNFKKGKDSVCPTKRGYFGESDEDNFTSSRDVKEDSGMPVDLSKSVIDNSTFSDDVRDVIEIPVKKNTESYVEVCMEKNPNENLTGNFFSICPTQERTVTECHEDICTSSEEENEVIPLEKSIRVDSCPGEPKLEGLCVNSPPKQLMNAITNEKDYLVNADVSVEAGRESYSNEPETDVLAVSIPKECIENPQMKSIRSLKRNYLTNLSEKGMGVDVKKAISLGKDDSVEPDDPAKSFSKECMALAENPLDRVKESKYPISPSQVRYLNESDEDTSTSSDDVIEVVELSVNLSESDINLSTSSDDEIEVIEISENKKTESHLDVLMGKNPIANLTEENVSICPTPKRPLSKYHEDISTSSEEGTEVIRIPLEQNIIVDSCSVKRKLEGISKDDSVIPDDPKKLFSKECMAVTEELHILKESKYSTSPTKGRYLSESDEVNSTSSDDVMEVLDIPVDFRESYINNSNTSSDDMIEVIEIPENTKTKSHLGVLMQKNPIENLTRENFLTCPTPERPVCKFHDDISTSSEEEVIRIPFRKSINKESCPVEPKSGHSKDDSVESGDPAISFAKERVAVAENTLNVLKASKYSTSPTKGRCLSESDDANSTSSDDVIEVLGIPTDLSESDICNSISSDDVIEVTEIPVKKKSESHLEKNPIEFLTEENFATCSTPETHVREVNEDIFTSFEERKEIIRNPLEACIRIESCSVEPKLGLSKHDSVEPDDPAKSVREECTSTTENTFDILKESKYSTSPTKGRYSRESDEDTSTSSDNVIEVLGIPVDLSKSDKGNSTSSDDEEIHVKEKTESLSEVPVEKYPINHLSVENFSTCPTPERPVSEYNEDISTPSKNRKQLINTIKNVKDCSLTASVLKKPDTEMYLIEPETDVSATFPSKECIENLETKIFNESPERGYLSGLSKEGIEVPVKKGIEVAICPTEGISNESVKHGFNKFSVQEMKIINCEKESLGKGDCMVPGEPAKSFSKACMEVAENTIDSLKESKYSKSPTKGRYLSESDIDNSVFSDDAIEVARIPVKKKTESHLEVLSDCTEKSPIENLTREMFSTPIPERPVSEPHEDLSTSSKKVKIVVRIALEKCIGVDSCHVEPKLGLLKDVSAKSWPKQLINAIKCKKDCLVNTDVSVEPDTESYSNEPEADKGISTADFSAISPTKECIENPETKLFNTSPKGDYLTGISTEKPLSESDMDIATAETKTVAEMIESMVRSRRENGSSTEPKIKEFANESAEDISGKLSLEQEMKATGILEEGEIRSNFSPEPDTESVSDVPTDLSPKNRMKFLTNLLDSKKVVNYSSKRHSKKSGPTMLPAGECAKSSAKHRMEFLEKFLDREKEVNTKTHDPANSSSDEATELSPQNRMKFLGNLLGDTKKSVKYDLAKSYAAETKEIEKNITRSARKDIISPELKTTRHFQNTHDDRTSFGENKFRKRRQYESDTFPETNGERYSTDSFGPTKSSADVMGAVKKFEQRMRNDYNTTEMNISKNSQNINSREPYIESKPRKWRRYYESDNYYAEAYARQSRESDRPLPARSSLGEIEKMSTQRARKDNSAERDMARHSQNILSDTESKFRKRYKSTYDCDELSDDDGFPSTSYKKSKIYRERKLEKEDRSRRRLGPESGREPFDLRQYLLSGSRRNDVAEPENKSNAASLSFRQFSKANCTAYFESRNDTSEPTCQNNQSRGLKRNLQVNRKEKLESKEEFQKKFLAYLNGKNVVSKHDLDKSLNYLSKHAANNRLLSLFSSPQLENRKTHLERCRNGSRKRNKKCIMHSTPNSQKASSFQISNDAFEDQNDFSVPIRLDKTNFEHSTPVCIEPEKRKSAPNLNVNDFEEDIEDNFSLCNNEVLERKKKYAIPSTSNSQEASSFRFPTDSFKSKSKISVSKRRLDSFPTIWIEPRERKNSLNIEIGCEDVTKNFSPHKSLKKKKEYSIFSISNSQRPASFQVSTDSFKNQDKISVSKALAGNIMHSTVTSPNTTESRKRKKYQDINLNDNEDAADNFSSHKSWKGDEYALASTSRYQRASSFLMTKDPFKNQGNVYELENTDIPFENQSKSNSPDTPCANREIKGSIIIHGKERFATNFLLRILRWDPKWLYSLSLTDCWTHICDSYSTVQTFYNGLEQYCATFEPLHFLSTWYEMLNSYRERNLECINCECKSVRTTDRTFLKIVCSTKLEKFKVSPKPEDIVLCRAGQKEAFLRIRHIMKESHTNIVDSLEINMDSLPDFDLKAGDKVSLFVMCNIKMSSLQNGALRSVCSGMSGVIFNPVAYSDRIEIVKLDRRMHLKKQTDDIFDSFAIRRSRVTLVDTSNLEYNSMLVVQVINSLVTQTNNKIVICMKDERSFHDILNYLIKFDPVLAVCTGIFDVKEEFKKFCIKNRMLEMEECIHDIIKKRRLFLTTLSAFEMVTLAKLRKVTLIIDDAHTYSEPESAPAFALDVQKVLLFGKPIGIRNMNSKLKRYGFNVSLFLRVLQAKQKDV